MQELNKINCLRLMLNSQTLVPFFGICMVACHWLIYNLAQLKPNAHGNGFAFLMTHEYKDCRTCHMPTEQTIYNKTEKELL